MGLFDRLLNKNNSNDNATTFQIPASSLVKSENYATTNSTQNNTIPEIDEETALKIGALYQGINIIGDTIASLPCYLYREAEGFHEVFYDDNRSLMLSNMANETLSAFNLKKNILKDLILRGNAYAKIERNGKDIMLRYLPLEVVTPKKDGTGYYFEVKAYSTDVEGEKFEAEIVDFSDMLVVTKDNKYNSLKGRGILDYANDVLAMSIEESSYMYNLLTNGLSSKAILNSKTPFRKEIKEQLKRDLVSFYSGANNAGKIMVLEGDVGVLPLAMSPADIKLLENKKFTITEISRYLNIPKHMLGLDRTSGTYSNITQERLALMQNTLMPYVTIIEQALNQKLLEEKELLAGYYFKFDVSELMKMTPSDQAEYMLNLFNANIVTIEEVRATLGLGGDAQTIAELKLIQQTKTQEAIEGQDDSIEDTDSKTKVDTNTKNIDIIENSTNTKETKTKKQEIAE